jgi:GNAT superfamily N-acetyltransferase
MDAEVIEATREDLDCILAWLEREYNEDDGVGFWCNRSTITKAFSKPGHFWVIRQNGEAVAFQVGEFAADILSVRKDQRKCGLARRLVEASIGRAEAKNVNVLSVQCAPETSLGFWERMGFEEYRDPHQPDDLTVRHVLARTFKLPPNFPTVEVVVGFYPEASQYDRSNDMKPIGENRVAGSRNQDGSITLARRILGLRDDEPDGRDLVVKVEVDGMELCFCKAKYQSAQDVGVQRDEVGGTFYLDCLSPKKDGAQRP